jgi:hypothetical protein
MRFLDDAAASRSTPTGSGALNRKDALFSGSDEDGVQLGDHRRAHGDL